MISGINRTDNKEHQDEEIIKEEENKAKKEKKHDGFLTLEKDHSKLDLIKYDLEFDVDPLFKNMTARFNQSGARGLLLKSLPIDINMNILLESIDNKNIKQNEKLNENVLNIYKGNQQLLFLDFINNTSYEEITNNEIIPDLSYFKRDIQDNSIHESNLLEELQNLQENGTEMLNIGENENYCINPNDIHEITHIKNESNNLENDYLEQEPVPIEEPILPDRNIFLNLIGNGNKFIFSSLTNIKNYVHPLNKSIFIDKSSSENLNKKLKKEENAYQFNPLNEIKKEEIFKLTSISSKKKQKIISNKSKKLERKLREQAYYRNDNILLNTFCYPDEICVADLTEKQKLHDLNEMRNINSLHELPQTAEVIFPDENNEVENLAKIDKEYEKKYGRLYKTFDVRFLKNKISECLQQTKNETMEEGVSFDRLIKNVSLNLSKEVKNNISTQTCFVCLLHLANEKSIIYLIIDLSLEQAEDDPTLSFLIK